MKSGVPSYGLCCSESSQQSLMPGRGDANQGGLRCLGGCSLQQKGDKKQQQDNYSLKPLSTSLQLASEHA